MNNKEAIRTLKANYPDACFEQLREAVDAAISALKAQQAAGDAISRRAALDALRTCYDTETVTMSNGDEYINYEDAVGEIEQLPSAQPEIIHCRDCKHWREGDAYSYCQKLFNCGVLDVYDYMRADDDFCSEAERRTNG